jgi:hypothetical protein
MFGHLMLLKRIRDLYPKDSASTYATRHIVMNWQQYFPKSTSCPSVIYLDFWPFSSEPIAIIVDPAMCQTVTADRFPIRRKQLLYTILTPSRRNFSPLWHMPQRTCHTAASETGHGHIVTIFCPKSYETTRLAL